MRQLALAKLRARVKEKERARADFTKYQGDPLAYATDVLRVRWWAKQQEIAASVRDNSRTLVKAAHGVGKTHVSGGLVNWFFDSFPGSVIPTTAPTGHQVIDLLWKEVRAQRRTKPTAGTKALRDEDNADHYAVGFAPQKNVMADEFGAQAAQGFHAEHLLFVLDEAVGVRAEIWNAIDGVVVGGKNKVLAIGNPTVSSGPYYDAARGGRYNVITVSALEHPNIAAGLKGEPDPYPGAVSLEWLMDKLDNPYWAERLSGPSDEPSAFQFPPGSGTWYLPGPMAESRILGEFPTTTTITVWPLAYLERARVRQLEWQEGDPIEVGVDTARFGDDATAAHSRRGPVSLAHQSWRKTSDMETAGRVKRHLEMVWKECPTAPYAVIKIDTTGGHGAGPADRLRELFRDDGKVQIMDISASDKAVSSSDYPNRRSELWFTSADRGARGELDLTLLDQRDYDTLAAQLTTPRFAYDSDGRKVVEKKDEIKKRTGRSPDDADAFNLAYAGWGGRPTTGDQLQRPSQWARMGPESPEALEQKPGFGPTGRSRFKGRFDE